MIDGRGGRLLPILAAVLLLVALSLSLAYFLLKVPDNRKIDEALISAEMAVAEGRSKQAERELLRASRYALSVGHWTKILSLSAEIISENPESRDYRLFTTLAGQASQSVPGNQNFLAYFAWGELRSGNGEKAFDASEYLGGDWDPLRAEIRLTRSLDEGGSNLAEFTDELTRHSDGEYFEHAAALSGSAELSLNAALLYMQSGRLDEALDIAEDIASGNRQWSDPETPNRRGVYDALARIAFDNGDSDTAIRWSEISLEYSRKRRTVLWENLQFLGDMYWESFLVRGSPGFRTRAIDTWYEALEIVFPEPDTVPPDASWRLWLNLSVAENSAGNKRKSEALLREALTLFGDRSEIKAAWARTHMDDNPGMARRMVTSDGSDNMDPILGITSLQVDPESISPRLYEAKLWELFTEVTKEESELQSVDARVITTFLLEYMSSRKNFSSIDVAIDRYLRVRPDDTWILSWRLAADAARWLAVIDLIPAASGGNSPYSMMRNAVRNDGSWRGLHDSALFALLGARELRGLANGIAEVPGGGGMEYRDAFLLNAISGSATSYRIAGEPLGDRIFSLERARNDTEKARRTLVQSGRNGQAARSAVKAAMLEEVGALYANALDDLDLALNSGDLQAENQAELLYLKATVLNELGRKSEAEQLANDVLNLDPGHPRVRELIENEVTF